MARNYCYPVLKGRYPYNRDKYATISKNELLSFFHQRYNHLTGLRSVTARYYITLVGALTAVIGFCVKEMTPDSANGLVGKLKWELAFMFFLFGLIGFFTVLYDSIIRKVAQGSCDAIEYLMRNSSGDFPKEEKDIEKKRSWRIFSEEFCFSSALSFIDAACLSLSTYFFFWESSYDYNIIYHFVCWIAVILIFRKFTVISYPTKKWGLPHSDRFEVNRIGKPQDS